MRLCRLLQRRLPRCRSTRKRSTRPARSTVSRDSPASTAPTFYGLPRNAGSVTLVRDAWRVPETLPFGDETIVPLSAGRELRWRIAHE